MSRRRNHHPEPPPPPKPKPAPKPSVPVSYSVVFNSNVLSTDWMVSDWAAPLGGRFDPRFVTLRDGCLALKCTQELQNGGLVNVGGEVQCLKGPFGYGTYTWVARMGSTAAKPTTAAKPSSGSVSGLFTFINDSESEIDFETLGSDAGSLYLTNWNLPQGQGRRNQESKLPVPNIAADFHEFKFVWSAHQIDYYMDGKLLKSHIQNVPTKPAFVMINHWGGTPEWGGAPSPGVTRYLYVKSFSYVGV